jgi:hypothetical protein
MCKQGGWERMLARRRMPVGGLSEVCVFFQIVSSAHGSCLPCIFRAEVLKDKIMLHNPHSV